MHLEVLVGSEEPKNYHLNKSKISLGAADNNDIVIDAQGVSRKHISLLIENDHVFIVDQGSTNGSFLNDQRLIPGKKIEFTSFFPLRLGDNVLISLIFEEEIPVPETVLVKLDAPVKNLDDQTRQLSLKDLQDKAKTKKLINESQAKRKIAKTKAKVHKKKKEFKISFLQILGVGILGCGAYYNWMLKAPQKEVKIAKVGQIVESVKLEDIKPKVELVEPTPLSSLSTLLNDLKCVNEVEKFLCQTIPNTSNGPWGVIQVGTKQNILTDGTPQLDQATSLLKGNSNEQDIKLTAATLYLLNVVPNDMDENLLKDYTLNFSLFSEVDGSQVPKVSFAISYQLLKELKTVLTQDKVRAISDKGISALDFVKDYLKVI